ncbi:MAG: DegV family protein [Lachnospiraceae bacterium]
MKKIAVVTDSNSGITQKEGQALNVQVIPMPFFINGNLYLEDITLSPEEFYTFLDADAEISTSQPSLGEVADYWNELLQTYDEIVHIPMSSGLSTTCENAIMMSNDYDGKVQVVNNQRISVTQRQSVMDALRLVEAGYNAREIKEVLEQEKMEASIYLTLATLKYLRKGGRITPTAAAIGEVLNIKPVLQINGEKLDAYSKARSPKQAKKIMLKAIKSDMKHQFKEAYENGQMNIFAVYGGNAAEAAIWKGEIQELFPEYEIMLDRLSLSVSCHIGHDVLAVACAKSVTIDKKSKE